jgi:hypothetical protein
MMVKWLVTAIFESVVAKKSLFKVKFNSSSPPAQIHPHTTASAFSHVKEGVSVLMDAFKQFANKNIIECLMPFFVV